VGGAAGGGVGYLERGERAQSCGQDVQHEFAVLEDGSDVVAGWLETREAAGGESFITFSGHEPGHDDELYLSLHLKGTPVNSPDPRLDALVDFLAHAPADVSDLIDEVRRLEH
jgi:hypothetical protein